MTTLLFSAVLALASPGDVGAPPFHDLHVSYGSAVVEGNVLVVRLRLFKDDLEIALQGHSGRRGLAMAVNPDIDGLFMAYLTERFQIEVGDRSLPGRIIGSGEEELGREPGGWYAIQFEAPEPIERFKARNTLLLDLFDDQRNIVKFVHFPDQTQKTYSFGRGEEQFEVRF